MNPSEKKLSTQERFEKILDHARCIQESIVEAAKKGGSNPGLERWHELVGRIRSKILMGTTPRYEIISNIVDDITAPDDEVLYAVKIKDESGSGLVAALRTSIEEIKGCDPSNDHARCSFFSSIRQVYTIASMNRLSDELDSLRCCSFLGKRR